ncbi:MAG: nucleotidyltransferase family protein [Firmicutes bacterium]|nr:nucleotidyltransferase family protein [Bacillota bacterium]
MKIPHPGELRHLLRTGGKLAGLVPENVCVTLEQLLSSGHCPASLSWLERSILCKLRTMKPEDFSALPDLSEGLENRLHTAAREARSLEELYSLVKSKRYSHARIRRLVMSAFLEIPSGLPELPLYLRILGMTETGARILKDATPTLPVAVRPVDFERLGGSFANLFRLEARADDLARHVVFHNAVVVSQTYDQPIGAGDVAGGQFVGKDVDKRRVLQNQIRLLPPGRRLDHLLLFQQLSLNLSCVALGCDCHENHPFFVFYGAACRRICPVAFGPVH